MVCLFEQRGNPNWILCDEEYNQTKPNHVGNLTEKKINERLKWDNKISKMKTMKGKKLPFEMMEKTRASNTSSEWKSIKTIQKYDY